jgi:membrane protein implicated in regulation of membrane protease activity
MVAPTNGGPPPPPPNPCTEPACLDAKAELTTARTAHQQTCKALKTVTSILRILRPIVSVPIWYLLAIVIVAIVLFWLGLGWIAILLWAIVLIYLLAWLAYLAFTRIAAALDQQLTDRSTAVEDAIAKVVAGCPERCRGDLSIPSCDP